MDTLFSHIELRKVDFPEDGRPIMETVAHLRSFRRLSDRAFSAVSAVFFIIKDYRSNITAGQGVGAWMRDGSFGSGIYSKALKIDMIDKIAMLEVCCGRRQETH